VLVGEEAQLAQALRLVRQHRRVQDVLHGEVAGRLYRAWLLSSVLLLLSVLLWTFGTPPPVAMAGSPPRLGAADGFFARGVLC
jgi:hypothetical protein